MFRKCLSLPVKHSKKFLILNPVALIETGHNFIPKRGAGHAKWQNIKSTKEAADFQKSKHFQKITRQILLAVKKGGEDPNSNSELKTLLNEANKINMPKATVQKAIQTARSQLEQPYWIVFTGPRGIALGLEVTFANRNSNFLNSKIAPQTKKINLKMEVHFHDICTEKGIIITKRFSDDAAAYEKALEHGIEMGADEVFEGENKTLIFECPSDRLDGLCSQLIKLGYEINSASTELDFKEQVVLSDEEKKDIETVVAKLQEQHEEIIRATYNSAG